jgi:hypothetical protein
MFSAYVFEIAPSFEKLRCAFTACSGSNVHSISSMPAASARSRCASFSARPRPCARVPGTTPIMCDHCAGFPPTIEAIENAKPASVPSARSAPISMPPRFAHRNSMIAGTRSSLSV